MANAFVLTPVVMQAFASEMSKLALSGNMARFVEGAKHEVGPALGAVLGAGTAKVVGIDPLAGAAAGYGLGASGDIVKALRKKSLGIHPEKEVSWGEMRQVAKARRAAPTAVPSAVAA